MLSAHSWLIAAIFVPYMVMMVILFAYMWTGPPSPERQREAPDSGEGDEPDLLPLA